MRAADNNQVTHITHIRWEIPHDKSGRNSQSRKLENAPTRHPGPLDPPFSFTVRTFFDVLAGDSDFYLLTLPTA